MNNLDTISSISSISFTDINNENTVASNTYEEIMNEAKLLNNGKTLVSSTPNDFNVMSVNNGIPKILDTEENKISDISATSNFNTSILNDLNLSSTSSAFMEEIAGQDGGRTNKKAMLSPFDEISDSSDSDSSDSTSDSSSTTDLSSMTPKSKKSTKHDTSESEDGPMSEPEESVQAGQGFVSGTRYLYSETITETSYNKVNDKSFFAGGSDVSSEFNTEDLTLLKN